MEFRVYQNQFFGILFLLKFTRIWTSFKLPILFLILNLVFIKTFQVLIILILKKKQWCKAIGSKIIALSTVVLFFMVQSYNSMLITQYYIFLSNVFNSIKETIVQSCWFFNKIFLCNRPYPSQSFLFLLIFTDIYFCCFLMHI